ncbi:hypothetical protein MHO82_12490 [Vibrio sp. Of7-15]|uniref:hypothetical protein n=1 Tax=Vibrio sp. Of7-15 TaxID=2724879 RepID=UPI001EF3C2E5|nr:hypothetical protein [Vibrio sp. Of7-15]MCG7497683.1 hypothetical protein [Vibrio sp. Of7-15]
MKFNKYFNSTLIAFLISFNCNATAEGAKKKEDCLFLEEGKIYEHHDVNGELCFYSDYPSNTIIKKTLKIQEAADSSYFRPTHMKLRVVQYQDDGSKLVSRHSNSKNVGPIFGLKSNSAMYIFRVENKFTVTRWEPLQARMSYWLLKEFSDHEILLGNEKPLGDRSELSAANVSSGYIILKDYAKGVISAGVGGYTGNLAGGSNVPTSNVVAGVVGGTVTVVVSPVATPFVGAVVGAAVTGYITDDINSGRVSLVDIMPIQPNPPGQPLKPLPRPGDSDGGGGGIGGIGGGIGGIGGGIGGGGGGGGISLPGDVIIIDNGIGKEELPDGTVTIGTPIITHVSAGGKKCTDCHKDND